MFYMYFQTAFDTVYHEILQNNLHRYSISGNISISLTDSEATEHPQTVYRRKGLVSFNPAEGGWLNSK